MRLNWEWNNKLYKNKEGINVDLNKLGIFLILYNKLDSRIMLVKWGKWEIK